MKNDNYNSTIWLKKHTPIFDNRNKKNSGDFFSSYLMVSPEVGGILGRLVGQVVNDLLDTHENGQISERVNKLIQEFDNALGAMLDYCSDSEYFNMIATQLDAGIDGFLYENLFLLINLRTGVELNNNAIGLPYRQLFSEIDAALINKTVRSGVGIDSNKANSDGTGENVTLSNSESDIKLEQAVKIAQENIRESAREAAIITLAEYKKTNPTHTVQKEDLGGNAVSSQINSSIVLSLIMLTITGIVSLIIWYFFDTDAYLKTYGGVMAALFAYMGYINASKFKIVGWESVHPASIIYPIIMVLIGISIFNYF